MRSRLIATLSAVVLMAGPALAQTTPTTPNPGASPRSAAPGTSPSMLPAEAKAPPGPNPLQMEDISRINGTAVYGSDDKKIGSISTVLMNPESKTVDRFVVTEGGLLGVGAHKVALPLEQFSWDGDKRGFKISKTVDDLNAMPEWQRQTASATTE